MLMQTGITTWASQDCKYPWRYTVSEGYCRGPNRHGAYRRKDAGQNERVHNGQLRGLAANDAKHGRNVEERRIYRFYGKVSWEARPRPANIGRPISTLCSPVRMVP
jgi:hypothetical protein